MVQISMLQAMGLLIVVGGIICKISRMQQQINLLADDDCKDCSDLIEENKKIWAAFYTAQSRVAVLEERINSGRAPTLKKQVERT